jgi:glutamate/tyrosine decarboxylase-like PLP-dependent enzyme
MALARDVQLPGRWDKGVVYCSDQAHSSVERGLRFIGIQPSQVHKLVSDRGFRLSLDALREAIADDRSLGKTPYCVVATAGTTNTGSVDPLPEIAELCREEGLWLHVDGAYGAAAVFSEKGRVLLKGLDQVDSLTLDPHKWMFQPYETGCLLVRDRSQLSERYHVLPEYLRDLDPSEEEINFYDYGTQLTRSFRALKLWLSLQVFGSKSFTKAIDRGFELAEKAEKRVKASKHLSLVTPAQMGILTFRYDLSGASSRWSDEYHSRIVASMLEDGFAFVSSTKLRGRTVLHMCTINPRTTEDDIYRTIEKIETLGQRLVEDQ